MRESGGQVENGNERLRGRGSRGERDGFLMDFVDKWDQTPAARIQNLTERQKPEGQRE